MEVFDSELKVQEPVGYLINGNIKTKIPVFENFGWFRTLI